MKRNILILLLLLCLMIAFLGLSGVWTLSQSPSESDRNMSKPYFITHFYEANESIAVHADIVHLNDTFLAAYPDHKNVLEKACDPEVQTMKWMDGYRWLGSVGSDPDEVAYNTWLALFEGVGDPENPKEGLYEYRGKYFWMFGQLVVPHPGPTALAQ